MNQHMRLTWLWMIFNRLHIALLAVCLWLAACESDTKSGSATQTPVDTFGIELDDDTDDFLALGTELREPFMGDFDDAVKRRVIRALVVPGRQNYFLDGARERGLISDKLQALESQINADLGPGHLKVHVVAVPTRRDRLLADLAAGRGDFVAANLTPTPTRVAQVDFSAPIYREVDEVLVTAADAAPVVSLQDLSGRQIYVRASSSYWENLQRLNREFRSAGLAPMELIAADELLETDDILEMANAGLVNYTFADDYIADFWSSVFTNIVVYPNLRLATGGQISWVMRKDSPGFRVVLDTFATKHRRGTLHGNVLLQRYFSKQAKLVDASASTEMARYQAAISLFEKYGEQYDFDKLILAAMGYQESRLDQSARSKAGAIGVMQMLKSTARDKNVGIPNIEKLEPNIHAGTRYLRFLIDRYFDDPGITRLNRYLFGFAGYNAGPSRVQRLRRMAADAGLDGNVWFQNVELMAAKEIGRETVQYVRNIYKYYVTYRLLEHHHEKRLRLPPAPA